MDNPFVESFNGRLRDEHPNVELFLSVHDAQFPEGQRDYDGVRPHAAFANVPPREFFTL